MSGVHVKRLWGCVQHSSPQVKVAMKQLSKLYFDGKIRPLIVDWQSSDDDLTSHNLWIVEGVPLMQSLVAREASHKKWKLKAKTVVVLDNVALTTQYKDIVLLDAKAIKSYHFKFSGLDLENIYELTSITAEEPITFNRVSIIPDMLNAQPVSALHWIMTANYKISDLAKREKMLFDLFSAIRNPPATGFDLSVYPWYNPKNNSLVTLQNWMFSPEGAAVCTLLGRAMNKIKSTDGNEEFYSLADDLKISKFDINYAAVYMKRHNLMDFESDIKTMYLSNVNRVEEY